METIQRLEGFSAETAVLRAAQAAGGKIQVARVSSAQAMGRAKRYAYWGVAIYEIAVGRANHLHLRCVSGASSDRRSVRLAEQDAEATGLPVVSGLSLSSICRELVA